MQQRYSLAHLHMMGVLWNYTSYQVPVTANILMVRRMELPPRNDASNDALGAFDSTNGNETSGLCDTEEIP